MLQAALNFWVWRLDVVVVLVASGLIYIVGWWRLNKHYQQVNWQGLLFYLLGLIVIAITLMSPIETWQALLFYVHMFQHELLIYLIPPFLLLGKPFPCILWGLPNSLRKGFGRLLKNKNLVRISLEFVTKPIVAFILANAILWLWHLPAAYNLALRNSFVHDLEHITFFLAFLLYWWPLIGSPPLQTKLRSNGARGLYLLLGGVSTALLGAIIALTDRVIYTYYLTVPRLSNLTPLADQQIAGAIMWLPGPLIYGLIAILTMREE